jgi:hypothetical protein
MPPRHLSAHRVARLVAFTIAACTSTDAPTTADEQSQGSKVVVVSEGLVDGRSRKKVFSLTMTTTGSGAGTVAKSPSAAKYATGTLVTATASPDTGSSFTRWSGDCAGTEATCTVTMNSNLTVTAEFSTLATFALTLRSSGNGAGSISAAPSALAYPAGTTVTLSATPVTGSSFSGWSGACTGMATVCVVTMDTNQTVEAAFSNTKFDGTYSGTFNGTMSSTAGAMGLSGPIAFTIQNGIVTITAPGSGTGSVTTAGQGTITCNVGTLGPCTISGTFTVSGSTVTGSGNYGCPYGSGSSGTWTAHR